MRDGIGGQHHGHAGPAGHLLGHDRRGQNGRVYLAVQQQADGLFGGANFDRDRLTGRIREQAVEAGGADTWNTEGGDALADQFTRIQQQLSVTCYECVADGVWNFGQHLEAEFLCPIVGKVRGIQHQVERRAGPHLVPVGVKVGAGEKAAGPFGGLPEVVAQRLERLASLLLVQDGLYGEHQFVVRRKAGLGHSECQQQQRT